MDFRQSFFKPEEKEGITEFELGLPYSSSTSTPYFGG
jgi:hypothetical protein